MPDNRRFPKDTAYLRWVEKQNEIERRERVQSGDRALYSRGGANAPWWIFWPGLILTLAVLWKIWVALQPVPHRAYPRHLNVPYMSPPTIAGSPLPGVLRP
jgi:hypothetical protein